MAKHTPRNSGSGLVGSDIGFISSTQSTGEKGLSQRQLRVAEQLKHVLSEILVRFDFHDQTIGTAGVTISEVRISPDLKYAKVFVLSLMGKDMKDVTDALGQHTSEIRRLVAKKVHMRYLPQFHFVVDKSFFEVNKINSLFMSQHVRQDIEPHDFSNEDGPFKS